MKKEEREKLEEKYIKSKTPYDNDIQCSIKEISDLKQCLMDWKNLEGFHKDYVKTIEDRLIFIQSKLDYLKNKADEYKK